MRKILVLLCLLFSFNSYSQTLELEEFVSFWLGTPYKLGGRSKNGIDCSQFNKRLYRDVYEINLPNVCSQQWNTTERISKSNLTTGDLVFFRSKQSPSGWHCGVYIGDSNFVHASSRKYGVIISSLNDKTYRSRYKGAGRLIM